MSVRSLARRRSVQYQPWARRRSSPDSVSSSTQARAWGPKSSSSSAAQRRLVGGGAQVRAQHVRVVGVEDRGLDGSAEQRLRVVDQVGVQRVVTRHQDAEGVPTPAPGPADLLPERGAGAGIAGEEHRVEAVHVDAELEGVRGCQTDQPPRAQVGLDRATLLGKIAAAVRRHPGRQRRVDLGDEPAGGGRHLLDPASGPDEGERADILDDQVGEQVGRLGGGGPAHRRAALAEVGDERRLPQRQRDLAARGVVAADGQHVQPGEATRRHLGVGHRRGGQHERRRRAVERGDPAAAAAAPGSRARRTRRGSDGTRRPRRSAGRTRTTPTCGVRAASSGAACRGW